MDIRQTESNVYHITYQTSQELAQAFFPFQEYYENKKFADTSFTKEEFDAWYQENYPGHKYEEDWSGFNIPLYMICKFKIDPVLNDLKNYSPLSIELFEFMEKVGPQAYLIGTTKDVDPSTLEHEERHARFYTDSEYKKNVLAILKDVDLGALSEHLVKISYHPKVILDECHAYIATEEEYLKEHGLWTEEMVNVKSAIQMLDIIIDGSEI